jgi:hypothetical protein
MTGMKIRGDFLYSRTDPLVISIVEISSMKEEITTKHVQSVINILGLSSETHTMKKETNNELLQIPTNDRIA